MDDIKVFAKNEKRVGNPSTGSGNIQSGYSDRIWPRKMWQADNENWKTTNDGRNRTTKSRKIRMLGEIYKYLRILKAKTIKQAEMKEKK